VTRFAGTMVAVTNSMLDDWQAPAKDGRPIDVFAEMMRVTLHIAVETLLASGERGAQSRERGRL